MSISSSLNASVSGLNANATRLATISDNIANSSTFGYKRAETDFHSMVIRGQYRGYTAGGVRTTNTRLIDQRGSIVTTQNATDLSIQGRGMLPVTRSNVNGNGAPIMQLVTTGSFRPDSQGYLRNSAGMTLMGWPADSSDNIPVYPRDSSNGLEPIRITNGQFAGEPTTKVGIVANLPATSTEAGKTVTPERLSIEYYDNLGRPTNLDVTFTPSVPQNGSSNEWTVEIKDSASNNAVIARYTITFDDTRANGGRLKTVTAQQGGAYNAAEGTFTVTTAGGPIDIDIGKIGGRSGLTQYSDAFSPTSINKNGTPVGSLSSINVDKNGFVRAILDTGASRVLYQVPLVDVPNLNGLESLDQQSYQISPDSGPFFLWDAGDGPTGNVVGFSREESTTDVAGELTQLIQTQRAYSSNAKVIQTVDEMLQETTNIKR